MSDTPEPVVIGHTLSWDWGTPNRCRVRCSCGEFEAWDDQSGRHGATHLTRVQNHMGTVLSHLLDLADHAPRDGHMWHSWDQLFDLRQAVLSLVRRERGDDG